MTAAEHSLFSLAGLRQLFVTFAIEWDVFLDSLAFVCTCESSAKIAQTRAPTVSGSALTVLITNAADGKRNCLTGAMYSRAHSPRSSAQGGKLSEGVCGATEQRH